MLAQSQIKKTLNQISSFDAIMQNKILSIVWYLQRAYQLLDHCDLQNSQICIQHIITICYQYCLGPTLLTNRLKTSSVQADIGNFDRLPKDLILVIIRSIGNVL